ncbi:hypothetical protein MMC08_002158 [Hypocenomyce scalaris]|nr:hypothetical protein [Hypocenomyce scalaris]
MAVGVTGTSPLKSSPPSPPPSAPSPTPPFKITPALDETYTDSLPSSSAIDEILALVLDSVTDTLTTYVPTPDHTSDPTSSSLYLLLAPVSPTTSPAPTPPPASLQPSARASAFQLCTRTWIPLTCHHLISKQVHAKAVKRGWHLEWRLNSVAWLCRACHGFVHGRKLI